MPGTILGYPISFVEFDTPITVREGEELRVRFSYRVGIPRVFVNGHRVDAAGIWGEIMTKLIDLTDCA